MRHTILVSLLILASLCSVLNAEEQKGVYRAAIDNDGVQRVDVLAGEYYFNPDYIVVKVNAPVELKVRKEPSIVPHDFVLKAPGTGIDVLEPLSKDPKSIRFTPTKPGKYPFYCDKKLIFSKSHREKGMEGVLEVVE